MSGIKNNTRDEVHLFIFLIKVNLRKKRNIKDTGKYKQINLLGKARKSDLFAHTTNKQSIKIIEIQLETYFFL